MFNKKLKRKYWNKKVNASKLGIGFNLSLEEYSQLIIDAKITVDDIGHSAYNLSRFNDTGDYSYSNCRFIPWKQNISERKTSDKMREASKNNVHKMNTNEAKLKREKSLEPYRNARRISKEKRLAKIKTNDTCWINNIVSVIKIKKDQLDNYISQGFKLGRKI